MTLDHKLRVAETRLFARYGLEPDAAFLDLSTAGVRLRVLRVGTGPDLVLLHGVSFAAAVWVPWLSALGGYRIHLVELPGHGLSGPVAYQVGRVRTHTLQLMDDLLARSASRARPCWATRSARCSRCGMRRRGRGRSPRSSPWATLRWRYREHASGCRCRL